MPAHKPIIVGMINNLMLSTRVEAAAAKLGYESVWIEDESKLGPDIVHEGAVHRQLAEHVEGRGAVLLDLITQLRPVLIIFDLGNQEIQWERWLALVKSVPATRRIPVVAFGPHVDKLAFESARERGADAVFARSYFMKHTEKVIQEHVSLVDQEAIVEACQMPLSSLAIKGLELFNQREYFAAHEELELAWNEDETPGRELYRGILQIAVAYLQVQRKNFRGAYKMFLRARQWIDPLPDICRGVNVAQLRQDAKKVREHLLALGPEGIGGIDMDLFTEIHYTIDHSLGNSP
jgi:predicted metal-dependent hydrolase